MTELRPVIESNLRLRTEIASGTYGGRKFTIDLNIDNKALFVFFEDSQQHILYDIPFEQMVEEADKLITIGAKAKLSK